MAERELYPDGEQRRRIMDFIMAAGQTLLENGAEVFRVEQTMEIMAASFHLREFHVYVLTNGIFASAGTAEMSEVRNVPTRTTHLGRVAAVNQLSRQIASGEVDTIDEAETRLAQARCIPFPKDWVQIAAGMGGAFCFALIFGGDLKAGLAAAAAGVAANAYLLFCGRHGVGGGFRTISTAALITLCCILGCSLLGTEASHAIIGTLMILTPGIAFTMGIRDFVQGDYLSGTIRMIDALLIAASIAIGTGLVLSLYAFLKGVAKALRLTSPVTSYTLRHSWATTAKFRGVPIEMISESLGHKSIKTTQIYLKGFGLKERTEVNKMNLSYVKNCPMGAL